MIAIFTLKTHEASLCRHKCFGCPSDRGDDNPAKAVEFNKKTSGIVLVTTNYVLDELYTLLLLQWVGDRRSEWRFGDGLPLKAGIEPNAVANDCDGIAIL